MGKVKAKKPVDIYEFNPEIYPRLLWVCQCSDASDMIDAFDMGATIDELNNMLEFSSATVTGVERNQDGKYGVLVFYKSKKNLTGSVIAHEAVHVADCIFAQLGMVKQDFTEKNEPYAYLVGWAAKCINQSRLPKKSKFKKQKNSKPSALRVWWKINKFI